MGISVLCPSLLNQVEMILRELFSNQFQIVTPLVCSSLVLLRCFTFVICGLTGQQLELHNYTIKPLQLLNVTLTITM